MQCETALILRKQASKPLMDLRRGDCFRILESVPDGAIDAVITDPPFGVTDCAWDDRLNLERWWELIQRKTQPGAIIAMFACGKFTPLAMTSNRKWYRYDLVWEKNRPVGFLDANYRPLRSHESILIFASKLRSGAIYNPQKTAPAHAPKPILKTRDASRIYHGQRSQWVGVYDGSKHPRSVLRFDVPVDRCHPTQKPLGLLRWLVRSYSNPGDLVVDPFMGSGTTAAACQLEGRRFLGCEKNAKYFAAAKRRIEQAGRGAAIAA